MNPFAILQLPYNCTDQDVRVAYHRLLREYSPEQNPEQFQMIQEAAGALKDSRSRARAMMIPDVSHPLSPIQAVEQFTRMPGRARPPGGQAVRDLLRSCAKAAPNKSSTK